MFERTTFLKEMNNEKQQISLKNLPLLTDRFPDIYHLIHLPDGNKHLKFHRGESKELIEDFIQKRTDNLNYVIFYKKEETRINIFLLPLVESA